MGLLTLYRRSLLHHGRAHVAVVLGVAVGTATLTGALVVGDSLRGSLRETALGGLGRIEFAVQTPGYFRAALAGQLAGPDRGAHVCPAILLRGSATHAESRAVVHTVNVLGVDRGLGEVGNSARDAEIAPATGRVVVLNRPLADELGARPGDDILLRVAKPAAISPETLLGRRDAAPLTLRLRVERVTPAEGLGAFTLQPRQTLPRNAYVPLATLQRALGQPGRINTLLVTGCGSAGRDVRALRNHVQQHVSLADLGLRLRGSAARNYVALESEAFLLAPPVEAAARAAAEALGAPTSAVLAYLANTIALEKSDSAAPASRKAGNAVIPYSTIAAVDPTNELLQGMELVPADEGVAGTPSTAPTLAPGEMLLNDWAATDLGARPGDALALTYYVAGPLGELDTQSATFRVRGVVRLTGAAADPGFTPEYPGVTDAASFADWKPPFPIDLGKVRPTDEAYWRAYRTTPKAYIGLADGQRLWTSGSARFGRLTSLRVHLPPVAADSPPGSMLAAAQAAFERELLQRLDVTHFGWTFDAVRAQAIAASQGSTDFAGLFLGFSFFLIVSAALLVALFFRLGVERRAREIGLLLATGFPRRRVARLLLSEGVLLALIGVGVGLPASGGYAWLMLAGLRSWWTGAANAPFLRLHTEPQNWLIGAAASVLLAVVSIAWSLRGVTRMSPRALLAGVAQASGATSSISVRAAGTRRGAAMLQRWATRMTRPSSVIAAFAACIAVVVIAFSSPTDLVSPPVGFFVGGTALLVACLAGVARWLQGEPPHITAPARKSGPPRRRRGLLRLGIRNARRHMGRSLLTAGLIAVATFVITTLQALRLEEPRTSARNSGTGGFALLAEATVPLTYDVNTPAGRAALNLPASAEDVLADVTVFPLRLRPGDEASCLNLYQPLRPRLLGAPDALLDRGGFAFTTTLAESAAERQNPWTLLRRAPADDRIPAIADEATVRWQLHLNLGDELHVTDERGSDQRLRLVGLLKGSILQGEIIIAESQFTRLFPSISGYGFFLVDVSPANAAGGQTRRQDAGAATAARTVAVTQLLERHLTDFGCEVTPTARRLAELFAVQNTYLATFQTLGGLGLLLGTVGLAAVLLRNIWERRSELALMRTVGFSRLALGGLVLVENAFLVAAGLLSGLLSAAVVVAPHVAARETPLPWGSLLLMFAVIFAGGLLAGVAALIPTLRAPLLPALRTE